MERDLHLEGKGPNKAFGFSLLSILIVACAHAPPVRSAEDHLLFGEFLESK
jgi:hypothetical protein